MASPATHRRAATLAVPITPLPLSVTPPTISIVAEVNSDSTRIKPSLFNVVLLPNPRMRFAPITRVPSNVPNVPVPVTDVIVRLAFPAFTVASFAVSNTPIVLSCSSVTV